MRKDSAHGTWLRSALAGVLLLAGLTAVGVSFAHNVQEKSAEAAFQYDRLGEGQVYLLRRQEDPEGQPEYTALSEDSWEATENGGSLSFLLANGTGPGEDQWCPYDQDVALTVYLTEGAGEAEQIAVTLRSGGSQYTGVPQRTEEGSALYERYGPGWSVRFYDSAGENVVWPIRGGGFFYREMALDVEGAPACCTAISLIAAGRPA